MSELKPYLLVVLLLALCTAPGAQELDDLLQESEEEESELRKIHGTEIGAEDEGAITGRLRLPKGEEVERLRLSQDREIDPEFYIVGPGDIIQLYIWGEFDLSYMLQVDPEGNVLIPTIDAFHVAGLSLSEVKESIHRVAQEKYSGVKVTITLSSMRFFTVYATGAVLREGSLIVHPTTRVSDLIEKAGGYLDELRGATIEEEVGGKRVTRVRRVQNQPASRRAIELRHGDGTVERVDLDMFFATGQIERNPYVRMGDVVHVHFRQNEVYLYGGVNEEGEQEFLAGDTVGDLITLAGGLHGAAPLAEAQLWRFLPDGVTNEVVDLAAVGGGELSLEAIGDFPLQPDDMLFLRTRSDWQQSPAVQVYGEVGFRGRYRILQGETRLRDIIEEAGGLTEGASLPHATLIRVKLRGLADPELARLRSLQAVSGLADMTPEDRAYLKTKGRERRGRIAVDFQRLFAEGDESQNILLEGGDVIFIPEERRTISVSGQVKTPGLIDFVEGGTVAYYLNKAGGYGWRANRGGARLIRARTSMREELDKKQVVEPGDEIWVPEKEYRDWWAITRSTVRTLAEGLAIIVLAGSI